jgi:hypothetical protein
MPTQTDDKKALSDAELRETMRQSGSTEAEENAALQRAEDDFYRPEPKKRTRASIPIALARKISKKQAYGAGGFLGLIISALIIIASFGSGPLELIHLSQILHLAHFAEQEAAGDGRLIKALRNISKTGADAGDTEISEVMDTYHSEVLQDLASIGIKPQFNADGTPSNKFTVDLQDANSPYKGMSPQDAAEAFAQKTGITPTINGADLEVSASNFWGSPSVENNTLGQMGLKGIATAARMRFEQLFGNAAFHPVEASETPDQMEEAEDAFVKNGVNPVGADTANAADQTTVDNKPVTAPDPGDVSTSNLGQVTTDLSTFAESGGVKTVGSAANVVGLVCALRLVAQNIQVFKYLDVLVPDMRKAALALSVGYQIMSGQDITATQVGTLVKDLSSTSSINIGGSSKDVTVSEFETPQLESDQGENITSADPLKANGEYNTLEEGLPSSVAWTEEGDTGTAISDLCNPVVQDANTALGVTVGVFSGGALAIAATGIASSLLGPHIISEAGHILEGDASYTSSTDAQTEGANTDVGAAALANDSAAHLGAGQVTNTEQGVVSSLSQEQAKKAFDSESFVARVFDIDNYQSLAGKLADSMLASSVSANISALVGNVIGSMSTITKLPFNILSSIASADAPTSTYAYPFPIVNFTEANLNSSIVGNPYTNAADVAHMLDTSCLNNDGTTNSSCSYITQAESCFGDEITKDNTDHVWDVIPNQPVNFYSSSYNKSLCNSPGPNNSWLRVSFFVFDTGVIEGYGCVQLHDPIACSDDGTTGNDTNTEASNTDAFAGTASNYDADIASIFAGSTS